MFRILFLALVTQAIAESQFSQGHIKYRDPSGTKVDWKLYAPYSQFKSQLREYQRRDERKSLAEPAAESSVEIGAKSTTDQRYKPFSQVPQHLKRLLKQSYDPEGPYVNPDAFLHQIPPYSFGDVISPKSQQMNHETKTETTIPRPRGQQQIFRQEKQNFGERESEEEMKQEKNQPQPSSLMSNNQRSIAFDKIVPLQIQQLLQYQAQIPYNVIANHIVFKPETPFVPEPLPEDEDGTYKYRSKIYYKVERKIKTNNDQEHPVTIKDRN